MQFIVTIAFALQINGWWLECNVCILCCTSPTLTRTGSVYGKGASSQTRQLVIVPFHKPGGWEQ